MWPEVPFLRSVCWAFFVAEAENGFAHGPGAKDSMTSKLVPASLSQRHSILIDSFDFLKSALVVTLAPT